MRLIASLLCIALARPIAAQAASVPSALGALSPAFTATGAFWALSVGDLEASVKWYSDKLGLQVTMRPPQAGDVSVVVLEGGGVIVELIYHDGSTAPGEPARQGIQKAGVIVSDFEHTLALLRERGVEIAYGPYPARNGQRANVIIKDNSGNLIQIFGAALR